MATSASSNSAAARHQCSDYDFDVSSSFLADPTNSCAYGTMCRPSVCRLSVTCTVAKWYVVQENCVKKQIGLPGRYLVIRPPIPPK